MSSYHQTSARTLLSVGQSALHKLSTLVWPKMPIALIEDKDVDAIHKVDIKLDAIANTLPEDEGHRWRAGDDPTPDLIMDTVDLTLSYKAKSTKKIRLSAVSSDSPSSAFNNSRFATLRRRFPILVRRAALEIEASLYTVLTDAAWTSSGFTNGPLSTPASNQTPIRDIEDDLDGTGVGATGMRLLAQLLGFELWAFTDSASLTALALHPQYGGIDVAVSAFGDIPKTAHEKAMFRRVLTERLKQTHGFDEVCVIDAIKTTAKQGESDSLARITGGGFFGYYLIKPGTFDHTTDDAEDQVDGAIALCMPKRTSRAMESMKGLLGNSWIDEGKMSEYFRVLYNYNWIKPRTTESGVVFGKIWTSVV
jgi:hypothetical protein